jgi:hypothetical protein
MEFKAFIAFLVLIFVNCKYSMRPQHQYTATDIRCLTTQKTEDLNDFCEL